MTDSFPVPLIGPTRRHRRRSAAYVRGAKPRERERGAIVTELAIVLPLLCLITFGSIQLANTLHLKQALTTAAFEGTRLATGSTASRTQILARVNEMLQARNVSNATVTLIPAGEILLLPPGTPVEIRITAPTAGNVPGPTFVNVSNSITVVGRTVH